VESGGAVRVFLPDGRWAMQSVADPSVERILAAAARARDLARLGVPPSCRESLPEQALEQDPEPPQSPAGDCDEYLRIAEETARRSDPGRLSAPFAMCVDGCTEIWIGNTAGMSGGCGRRSRHAVLGLQPRGGPVRFHRAAAAAPAVIAPEEFGAEAATLAAWPCLPPATLPRGGPVILHPAAAAEWIRLLSPRFVGGEPRRGAGFAVGERIGAAAFDLIDDGTMAGGIASGRFDGTGRPMRRRVLVEAGIVRRRIGEPDGAAAGEDAGGSLVRESFRDLPRLSTTNLFLPPGRHDAAGLRRVAPAAVLILNLFPPWGGDAVDADVRFSGCLLDNGAPAGGIRSGFIGGGAGAILRGVAERASDLRFYPLEGSFGSPTLLVDGVELSA
jgi:PmbA protein